MIETKRLMLRPFEETDLDLICSIYCDEEILRYTPFDPLSREQAEDHLHRVIEEWKASPHLSYEMAVILKETGDKIGRTHILIDPETDTGMIGTMLKREYWRRQYGIEITGALIHYSFNDLRLHRINALCNPANEASWKMLEKLGMRREAWLKQKCRYVKHGVTSWQDELEYAMLASEYQSGGL